ncbi:hypothetical protein IMZ31_21025 (plasmid) [Pontibacillus sp. ALD_SL1]|uniref:flagellar motor switch protein FliG n=1 Tax=Pontibacillus sp. ALD_SL1 TaxID=2777185 RepID=UPI001A95FE15|nr:FliG C-terminal domain-containing protein [Pontibacillus sp. ALD_SL1]QST03033.1 hypothetical protein IMZ31_21025 [Pontibacillus sp. ALD_SL1]
MENELLKEIEGRTRAALLLAFLPVPVRQKIVGFLTDEETAIMVKEVTDLPPFGADIIEQILLEYIRFIKGNTYGVVPGGVEEALKMLEGNMSEQDYNDYMARLYDGQHHFFEHLLRVGDVGPLATFLQNEDPQMISLIMSYMKPPKAAELMQRLPDKKQDDIVISLAQMGQANPDAVKEVDEYIRERMNSFTVDDTKKSEGGIKKLTNILNNINRSTEKKLFERLEKINPKLTQEIKDNMFLFEDLVVLDMLAMQKVIEKIPSDEIIATALKSAPVELQERFYQAMPNARKRVVDDVSEGLRIRQQDSEEAQQKIANIVKDLEQNDPNFVIPRGADDVIL